MRTSRHTPEGTPQPSPEYAGDTIMSSVPSSPGLAPVLPQAPALPPNVPVALDLAVVLPTYNERENIPLIVARLEAALAGLHWEAIFVDDDSPDGTAESCSRYAHQTPHAPAPSHRPPRPRLRLHRRHAGHLRARHRRHGRRPAARRDASCPQCFVACAPNLSISSSAPATPAAAAWATSPAPRSCSAASARRSATPSAAASSPTP